MNLKYLTYAIVVLLGLSATSARPRIISRRPCGCPQKQIFIPTMATPCSCFETIEFIQTAQKPCCQTCCNDQLILPPLSAELPCDLGYFPSALPFVAKVFNPAIDFLTTGAYLPVASSCNSLTLAVPVSPDIAPLVKPIIL